MKQCNSDIELEKAEFDGQEITLIRCQREKHSRHESHTAKGITNNQIWELKWDTIYPTDELEKYNRRFSKYDWIDDIDFDTILIRTQIEVIPHYDGGGNPDGDMLIITNIARHSDEDLWGITMSFDTLKLSPAIHKAIQGCGYQQPTPVQAQAVPAVLSGQDVLASAQTGTGKTAAFMLPALHMLSDFQKGPKGAPRVLVVTPTRELAAQITEATRTYGKFLRVRSTVILGGSSYGPQFRDLSRSIDLVIGTPGRLIDHLQRGSLNLSHLEMLILDEADRMLDMGFKQDMETIIAAAPAQRPRKPSMPAVWIEVDPAKSPAPPQAAADLWSTIPCCRPSLAPAG